MPTARLDIEYDGSGFAGWAKQPGLRTVQAELERALATILGRHVALTVAGRTDRGVHALGQVASHPGKPAPARSLNGVLPDDVAILESERAADAFDARRDAFSRTYRYRVLLRSAPSPFERGRALWWPRPVDRSALAGCAAALAGAHDFTAFTPSDGGHVHFHREVLRAEWLDEGEGVLAFVIEADAFMRNMVRVLVGTMLGGVEPDAFGRLLGGRPRSEAGATAPAHGLYLESVRY